MDLHSQVYLRCHNVRTHSIYFTIWIRYGHVDGVADGPNVAIFEIAKTPIFILKGRHIRRPFLFLRSLLMQRIIHTDRFVLRPAYDGDAGRVVQIME